MPHSLRDSSVEDVLAFMAFFIVHLQHVLLLLLLLRPSSSSLFDTINVTGILLNCSVRAIK